MIFVPGTKRSTMNAFGEHVRWIGRWTEYEYALWLKCESEVHLRSILDFQLAELHRKLEVATAKDDGWPKSMPLQIRLLLSHSSKSGWTPKISARETIGMNVKQVMRAFRDLEEWNFAHGSKGIVP